MKNTIKAIVLILLLGSNFLYAQTVSLSGYIDYKYRFDKTYLPLKINLFGKNYSDSTLMDSSFHFSFHDLKEGDYQLKVSALRGKTGFTDLLITNIDGTRDVKFDKIVLKSARMCEGAVIILGKKNEKVYYKTGELRAEGKYLHSYRINENAKKVPYFKKTGTWLYYSQNGELTQKALYINDELRSFTTYYPNGHQKMKGNYNSGCRTGDWFCFTEDGELQFVVNLDNIFITKINSRYIKSYAIFSNILD